MNQQIPIRRRLAGLTGPIFIEILLLMLLGAVDTVMLGLYSDQSVAAVGVVNQLLNLVFLIFGVTTAGTSVLCAQYLGAGQNKNFIQVIGVSLIFNLALGLLCGAGLFWGGGGLLRLMNLRPELMPDALTYIRVVGGFAFLPAVALTLSAILRSAGKAAYPMWVSVIINLLNIVGNYMLIFGKCGLPELGVLGAALSTTFSRHMALILLLIIMFRKVLPGISLRALLVFPLDKLRGLLGIGLPSAGEQVSYSLSQVVITYFINMLGNDALTARTYAVNIIMFTYLFSLALGLGTEICIGHLLGEGRKQAAYVLGRYSIRLSIIISIIMALVSALGGRHLMQLISSNTEVIAMVTTVLWIDVVLEPGRAVNILCVNTLRAAGDVGYAFIVGLIMMWGVATGLGYVFGITFGWGLAGMWVAFTLDENIRAVLLGRRWNSRRWMRKDLIDIHAGS